MGLPAEMPPRLPGRYRMPAEWEPHLGTYLVWPHNEATWPGCIEQARHAIALVAAALSRSEAVRILVPSAEMRRHAADMLAKAGANVRQVDLITIATDDSWIRDFGPIFVNRAEPTETIPAQIALNWRFNAWGGKYEPYALDDAVPRRLAAHYGFEVLDVDLVLEGGAIEVNGRGAVLASETCLLDTNRNGPRARRDVLERYLREYLGVDTVVWLAGAIAGDDTDGHVDQIARFVAEDHVVTMVEDDPADENYDTLRGNLDRLKAARLSDGRPLKIDLLPMPEPVFYRNARLPASYANFYIGNSCVLVPLFDCAQDQLAVELLSRLFSGREVIGIPATHLVVGLGAIHCLTMQHPTPSPTRL